jgi:DNA-binding response OmpR family regulator
VNGVKVLIVDDDRVWVRLLGDFLAGFGFEIHTALNCAEGLILAARHRPGCILVDFHLPDATAGSFCVRIRADQALKKTLLIVVSGDEREELNSYSKHQADGFVLKGEKLENIRLLVNSLLRRVS